MAAPENPQLSQPVALYYLRCLELLIYHRLQALNANVVRALSENCSSEVVNPWVTFPLNILSIDWLFCFRDDLQFLRGRRIPVW